MMDVEITEWALDSYLDNLHKGVFTRIDYKNILRPAASLLKDGWPSAHVQFTNSKFWGPATDLAGNTIAHGFKMKWHNFGAGNVQFRVCIALLNGQAFLCQGYVKNSDAVDKRQCAKLKVYIRDITLGKYASRGML